MAERVEITKKQERISADTLEKKLFLLTVFQKQ